jgi:hypothetical protein
MTAERAIGYLVAEELRTGPTGLGLRDRDGIGRGDPEQERDRKQQGGHDSEATGEESRGPTHGSSAAEQEVGL